MVVADVVTRPMGPLLLGCLLQPRGHPESPPSALSADPNYAVVKTETAPDFLPSCLLL